MNETDYAYIAGLMDGEGYFSLIADRGLRKGMKRNWSYYRPQMGISNSNREVLEWVRAECGFGFIGPVGQQRAFGTGDDSHLSKPVYTLTISANGVRAIVPHLLPFLRIKRDRARLVLEAANIIQNRGRGLHPVGVLGAVRRPYPKRMDTIYTDLRRLNAKGVTKWIREREFL